MQLSCVVGIDAGLFIDVASDLSIVAGQQIGAFSLQTCWLEWYRATMKTANLGHGTLFDRISVIKRSISSLLALSSGPEGHSVEQTLFPDTYPYRDPVRSKKGAKWQFFRLQLRRSNLWLAEFAGFQIGFKVLLPDRT